MSYSRAISRQVRHQPLATVKSGIRRPQDPSGQLRMGTVTRPPRLMAGSQAGRLPFRMTNVYTRTFKYRGILSTIGGQTFFLTNFYTYIPFAMTVINAGSILVVSGPSPTLSIYSAPFSTIESTRSIVLTVPMNPPPRHYLLSMLHCR